jgi:hypothetical protein
VVKPKRLSESHDCKKEKICIPTKSWATHRQASKSRSGRKRARRNLTSRAGRERVNVPRACRL